MYKVILVLSAFFLTIGSAPAKPSIQILRTTPPDRVKQYEKFEIDFLIAGSASSNAQWPYDPSPPKGVPASAGITVDAVFTDPNGIQYRQPAFYYQDFQTRIVKGRDWIYPTDAFNWKIRFSPNQPGNWHYRIVVLDRSGESETQDFPLQVVAGPGKGFIKVSQTDTRYFEFGNGSMFTGIGLNMDAYLNVPLTQAVREFEKLKASDINFARTWISSIFGSAWNPYRGSRNLYGGYIPRTGLSPFYDSATATTSLTMRIDYEAEGDAGWFDACRLAWSDAPVAVRPNTLYRIRVKYRGIGITGPRRNGRKYGFVVKMGGPPQQCTESGTGTPVTGYGGDNSSWGYLEGTWSSRSRNFLPRMFLSLENVKQGKVYVLEVSIREDLGNGRYGPEIMPKPSMEYQQYIPQKKSYALDKIIDLAEQNGVYLKLVLMEKDDDIYLKMNDDGGFITNKDNQDGFYGLGRSVNKTRWLQQAWWRYCQARWGYSPNIHSWELTNEGDPASQKHYEMADEFGKFMHCRVFGIDIGTGDGEACTYKHPDSHLVTTSFWHSMPSKQFWSNSMYPNIDYADVHAYISTSMAPAEEKKQMMDDAAFYHLWHSRNLGKRIADKPLVRGEAGMDVPGRQNERILGIQRDTSGIWLHNFLWSGLDAGGLYELYWWNSHIQGRNYDHHHIFKLVGYFLSEIPLNKGGYEDWNGTVSNPALRVVGQKNLHSGSMHLWIQNRMHTWKNNVEGKQAEPQSAEIVVPGFEPGVGYRIEWWDTYASEKTILSTQDVVADHNGLIKIFLNSLKRDIVLKVNRIL